MEAVVLLWMAEGFVVQHKENKMEAGKEYFNDLASRSFFQQSSFFLVPSFTMHDLMIDLARSVSGEFCIELENADSSKLTRRTRHLSFRAAEMDSYQTFEAIRNPQLLHTLMHLSPDVTYSHNKAICNLLPALKRVRVLSMHLLEHISVLDSIGNLKHLRYLDLAGTSITRLPDSLCSLYNLETLILLWCYRLDKLPAKMRRLINLFHLDIRHTQLLEMPPQMGKLTELRTLTTFIVGKQSGTSIKELGELQHLRGDLSIRNLQNVVDAQAAMEARLKAKEHLQKLELEWGGDLDDDDVFLHERVLEQLQPHVNVENLCIKGYGGTMFSNWLGNSSLPLLQELSIYRCPNLKKALSTPFPSLTELVMCQCEKLEIESFPLELFPSLESLTIDSCPNLVSFAREGSPAPNLRRLLLHNCSNLKSLANHMHLLLPSLVDLSIKSCPELDSFAEGDLPSSLRSLDIWHSDKLIAGRMLWGLRLLPCLSKFEVAHNEIMESFPEEMLLPSSLNLLEIWNLENLKSLNYKGFRHLTSLRELKIWFCPNLQSMPEEPLPSSLSYLEIHKCPLLEKRCGRELGEDWNKISHIPNIVVNLSKI